MCRRFRSGSSSVAHSSGDEDEHQQPDRRLEKNAMRGTCTLLMIVALLPSTSGTPIKPPVPANNVFLSGGGQIANAQHQDAGLFKHGFLTPPLEEHITGLSLLPLLLLGNGLTVRSKQLTHFSEGRISTDVLLSEMERFPWNLYLWLLLAGILVFLVQGALFIRLRSEARRRRVADRAARRSGEFEHLLSETASRLAE